MVKESRHNNMGSLEGPEGVPLSMIGWRAFRWVKIVSIVLIGTFLFQQIVWAAGDTFQHSYTDETIPDTSYPYSPEQFESVVAEQKAAIERLAERETDYQRSIQDVQASFDDSLETATDDQSDGGGDMLDEMQDQQTVRSTAAAAQAEAQAAAASTTLSSAGGNIDWTMANYDESGTPQTLVKYEYDGPSLDRIISYDISGLDLTNWIAQGGQIEGSDGINFIGGRFPLEGTDALTDDRILSITSYKGSYGNERVDYVLAGFDENGIPSQISTYNYFEDSDPDIDLVKTYDVGGLGISFTEGGWKTRLNDDILIRVTEYDNGPKKRFISCIYEDYGQKENGQYKPHKFSVYDYEGTGNDRELRNVRTYDVTTSYTDGDWDNTKTDLLSGDDAILLDYKEDLISDSLYIGPTDEERVDQVLYYEAGEIVERTDYEYGEYVTGYGKTEHALRKTLTYYTDDASLTEDQRKERGAGFIIEETTYIGLAGRERVDQTFYYDENEIVQRRDYIYDDTGALTNIYTFDTEGLADLDARQKWADGSFTGILLEESTFTGQRGREKIDQTFYYEAGQIVERKDYIYDDTGALVNVYTFDTVDLSEADARQKMDGDTYTGQLIEESTFTGIKGREVIDQTFSYQDEAIVERRDYVYDDSGALTHVYTFDTIGLTEIEARQKIDGEKYTGELIEEKK